MELHWLCSYVLFFFTLSGLEGRNIHIHTYAYIHMHTHTCMCTHCYIYTYTQARACTNTHTSPFEYFSLFKFLLILRSACIKELISKLLKIMKLYFYLSFFSQLLSSPVIGIQSKLWHYIREKAREWKIA